MRKCGDKLFLGEDEARSGQIGMKSSDRNVDMSLENGYCGAFFILSRFLGGFKAWKCNFRNFRTRFENIWGHKRLGGRRGPLPFGATDLGCRCSVRRALGGRGQGIPSSIPGGRPWGMFALVGVGGAGGGRGGRRAPTSACAARCMVARVSCGGTMAGLLTLLFPRTGRGGGVSCDAPLCGAVAQSLGHPSEGLRWSLWEEMKHGGGGLRGGQVAPPVSKRRRMKGKQAVTGGRGVSNAVACGHKRSSGAAGGDPAGWRALMRANSGGRCPPAPCLPLGVETWDGGYRPPSWGCWAAVVRSGRTEGPEGARGIRGSLLSLGQRAPSGMAC